MRSGFAVGDDGSFAGVCTNLVVHAWGSGDEFGSSRYFGGYGTDGGGEFWRGDSARKELFGAASGKRAELTQRASAEFADKRYPRAQPGMAVPQNQGRCVWKWVAQNGPWIYNFNVYLGGAMQVSKWGNSLAVRLPSAVVEALQLKEGDQIKIRIAAERTFEVSRDQSKPRALARLRKLRRPLPAG